MNFLCATMQLFKEKGNLFILKHLQLQNDKQLNFNYPLFSHLKWTSHFQFSISLNLSTSKNRITIRCRKRYHFPLPLSFSSSKVGKRPFTQLRLAHKHCNKHPFIASPRGVGKSKRERNRRGSAPAFYLLLLLPSHLTLPFNRCCNFIKIQLQVISTC